MTEVVKAEGFELGHQIDISNRDEETNNQHTRNAFLQIYAESFPGDSTCFGPPNTIVSGVYDSFPGLEQLVDKTLRGIQVEFDIGGGPTIGYYLDPPMYLKLHQELSKINGLQFFSKLQDSQSLFLAGIVLACQDRFGQVLNLRHMRSNLGKNWKAF